MIRVLWNLFNSYRLICFRGLLVLTVLFQLMLMPLAAPVLAQGGNCSTSSPVSAVYSVTVCITKPVDNTILAREASITATVRVTGANPGVQKLIFYLGGQYLLTDYEPAYTFILPTRKFVDGRRLLEVEAILRDGFTSRRATIDLTFNNGVSEPPVNTNTFTPPTGSTPPSGRPFILAATGDGASGERNADTVTELIATWNPNLFLYLGDVYDKGTFTEFYNWYGTGADHYSRLRAITHPTIGNHEYEGGEAPGYFDYWNNVPNYYSFNAASWHMINLNSNGQFDQTLPGTLQYNWLLDDLEANSAACTLVYFHHPLYNIGSEKEATRMNQIWALLAQHGVDMVLTGHDHNYQRWHALNGQGDPDPQGVTQFVIGTGGHGIQDFTRKDPRLAVGFDSSPAAFGALRMELNRNGAAYQYVNIAGATLDSGSIVCNQALPDTTSPAAPKDLTVTSNTSTHVDLIWTSATDNVGVTNYDIYRDGELFASTAAVTSYTDKSVVSGDTYRYQISARDAAGNVSGLSSTMTVTISELLFSDGFESGNFSQWTDVSGLAIQKEHVQVGDFAVRGISRDTPTHAYKQLPKVQKELYYRLWFKILKQGTNTVYLQRFRTSRNGAILGVFVSNTGRLGFRNDVIGASTTSATIVTPNTWHELQTHVRINGTASEIEVWLDEARIDLLSKAENLGTTAIGRIQLGDSARGRIYDVVLDRVALSTQFIDASKLGEGTRLPFISNVSFYPLWQHRDRVKHESFIARDAIPTQ
jgi:hypothetical protein